MVELTSMKLARFVCQNFGGTTVYSAPDFPLRRPTSIGNLIGDDFSFWTGSSLPKLAGRVAVICGRDAINLHKNSVMLLHVDNPRLVFGKAVEQFFAPKREGGVHPSAVVDETCKLSADVTVGAYSVLGPHCEIGQRSRIGSNVIIGPNVRIGEDCFIRSGSVIGEDGFGVEFEPDGKSYRLPHIGGVVLEDRVQVGSQCSIAAGTLEPTILHEDVQLDNKVHVAHNVEVGARSLITACAEISGSVVIGSDCWLGPNCSVINKIQIGCNSFIGLGAVVTKDVADNVVVAGSPARVLRPNSGTAG